MSPATRGLKGLGVVLTRPKGAVVELEQELTTAGARVLHFPALEITPVGESPALDAALAALPRQDIAIFVSANAVEMGLAALEAR